MGILTKFGRKESLGADVVLHGLLNHDTDNVYVEKALLWTGDLDAPLHRRHIGSVPAEIAPRQFPSWAWSGWTGPAKYAMSGGDSWRFWPGKSSSIITNGKALKQAMQSHSIQNMGASRCENSLGGLASKTLES